MVALALLVCMSWKSVLWVHLNDRGHVVRYLSEFWNIYDAIGDTSLLDRPERLNAYLKLGIRLLRCHVDSYKPM